MEQSRLVLGLLHSVLGKSKPSTKGNHAFHCPFCKHHKPKLEIDPKTGFYHCWTCEPATKGRNLVSLLKKEYPLVEIDFDENLITTIYFLTNNSYLLKKI